MFKYQRIYYFACMQDGALPHASLHLNQAQESGIPADYELTFQPGVAPMHIFSRDVYASGRMAVEGKVSHKEWWCSCIAI